MTGRGARGDEFNEFARDVALHVAGNLRHFVGTVLGGTGYVRQRELEFSRREGSRSEVAAELEAAMREVELGLRALTEATQAAPYAQVVVGVQPPTGRWLLHLVTHTAFHLGQAFGGGGNHFCLGANLARLELNEIFRGIVSRLHDIETAAPPRRLRSCFINGVKEMRVRFRPGPPED